MYAGNAVIVNLLMRWPALIPGAAIAGGVALAEPEAPPQLQLQWLCKRQPRQFLSWN